MFSLLLGMMDPLSTRSCRRFFKVQHDSVLCPCPWWYSQYSLALKFWGRGFGNGLASKGFSKFAFTASLNTKRIGMPRSVYCLLGWLFPKFPTRKGFVGIILAISFVLLDPAWFCFFYESSLSWPNWIKSSTLVAVAMSDWNIGKYCVWSCDW